MRTFLYARESSNGRVRFGVGVVAKVFNGIFMFIMGAVVIAVAAVMVWQLLFGKAHAEARLIVIPACTVLGQPVPCEHFITTDPNGNRIRDMRRKHQFFVIQRDHKDRDQSKE